MQFGRLSLPYHLCAEAVRDFHCSVELGGGVNLWRGKSGSNCEGLAYCDSDGDPTSWTEYSPTTVDAVLLYAHAMDALRRTAPSSSLADPDLLYAEMLQLPAFEGLTGSVRLGSDGDRLARFTLVNLYVCTTKDDSRCGRRRLASPGSTLSLEQTRAAFVTVGEYDSITQDLTVRPACHGSVCAWMCLTLPSSFVN